MGVDLDKNHRRRLWRNFLVNPKLQLRHAFVVLSSCLVTMTIFLAATLTMMTNTIENISATSSLDPTTQAMIIHSSRSVAVMLVASFVICSVAMLMMSIILSHRLYGPLVP